LKYELPAFLELYHWMEAAFAYNVLEQEGISLHM
jgi:hypothetical protein